MKFVGKSELSDMKLKGQRKHKNINVWLCTMYFHSFVLSTCLGDKIDLFIYLLFISSLISRLVSFPVFLGTL